MNTLVNNHRKVKICMILKDRIERQQFLIKNAEKFSFPFASQKTKLKAQFALDVFTRRLAKLRENTEVNYIISDPDDYSWLGEGDEQPEIDITDLYRALHHNLPIHIKKSA